MDCIFCRIARGEVPAKKVYEDDLVVAFDDVAPQAPVHVLVCPKVHYESLADLGDSERALAGALLLAARKVADAKGIAAKGFRVISNVREHGGQEVMHLHLHVVGGRRLGRMLPERSG